MNGDTLAVLLAAAIGLGLALILERQRNGRQAALMGREVYASPLGYSAFSSVSIGAIPSSPGTWALLF